MQCDSLFIILICSLLKRQLHSYLVKVIINRSESVIRTKLSSNRLWWFNKWSNWHRTLISKCQSIDYWFNSLKYFLKFLNLELFQFDTDRSISLFDQPTSTVFSLIDRLGFSTYHAHSYYPNVFHGIGNKRRKNYVGIGIPDAWPTRRRECLSQRRFCRRNQCRQKYLSRRRFCRRNHRRREVLSRWTSCRLIS